MTNNKAQSLGALLITHWSLIRHWAFVISHSTHPLFAQ